MPRPALQPNLRGGYEPHDQMPGLAGAMGRHSLGESHLPGQRPPEQMMPTRSMFSADADGYGPQPGMGMARQPSGLPPGYGPQGGYELQDGGHGPYDGSPRPYDGPEAYDRPSPGQMGHMRGSPRTGPGGPGPYGGPPGHMGGPGSPRGMPPGAGGALCCVRRRAACD